MRIGRVETACIETDFGLGKTIYTYIYAHDLVIVQKINTCHGH